MDNMVLEMLKDYNCKSHNEYENALKEIMQEIALLGLWRAKFFEHGVFYGGTALRILYKLPRFSEDLDFSLITKKHNFNLAPYYKSIKTELEAFGFEVTIKEKEKNIKTRVESAFIKASTKIHFIKVYTPREISSVIQGNQSLKIKIELDTDPPGNFSTEVKNIFRPIPFQIKTMPISDLFAGKCHAVLARQWQNRIKGRDFYDYLWYIRRKIPLNIKHLESRLTQSGHWDKDKKLTLKKVKELFMQKFNSLDIEETKKDVYFFLKSKERASLEVWSQQFFIDSLSQLHSIKT